MYVSFNGCHHQVALAAGRIATDALFLFDMRDQDGHCLLHHAGAFDHLGQEHFALTKKITNHVHSIHQRAFNHIQRATRVAACFLGVSFNVTIDAFYQSVHQAVVNR